ncbi:MAG: methyltransferase domain-containing protein [Sedimentibacter sp.]|uniref:class I SAM-dependent methyltransferase n=1 Tax=Sedimentibacter sp. TaxID=1960295 RepID=UPI00315906C5
MYENILDCLKNKPQLYEPSTAPFWDDENISRYMLDAHLNPSVEAASRQLDFIKESVEWISSMFKITSGKKLLDLGCGPGIYAELFAEKGFEVTGIDFSKRSIEYAIANAGLNGKNIDYIYKNYLDIDYRNEFDLITLIYCDFGVLSPNERTTVLCKIMNALKPGGILILDGFTNNQLSDVPEKQDLYYADAGFWCSKPHVCIQRNYHYIETKNYLEQYLIIKEDSCDCYNIWNQLFTMESLLDEIKSAGFENITFYDDVCGKKLSDKSKTICAVAQK